MLPEIKVCHIPVIKPHNNIDRRSISCADGIYNLLNIFLSKQNHSIVAVGTSLMSLPPTGDETYQGNEALFDSLIIFDECHFVDSRRAFEDIHTKYIWQYLPFFYTGDTLTGGFFDINTLIELNSLAVIDNFKTVSYGELKYTPAVFAHLSHINTIIDTLMNYYVDTKNANRSFILPFHPLEHFLSRGIDFDDAMMLYQRWFAAYQAFSAILQACKASFKVILGIPEWAYTPPDIEELKQYILSEGLGEVYKAPHKVVSETQKLEAEEINIDTFNSFDYGDIVTIITWQQSPQNKRQEFYYHVMGKGKAIDKMEQDYKNKHLTVKRSTVDFDDSIERFAVLNVSRALH